MSISEPSKAVYCLATYPDVEENTPYRYATKFKTLYLLYYNFNIHWDIDLANRKILAKQIVIKLNKNVLLTDMIIVACNRVVDPTTTESFEH